MHNMSSFDNQDSEKGLSDQQRSSTEGGLRRTGLPRDRDSWHCGEGGERGSLQPERSLRR